MYRSLVFALLLPLAPAQAASILGDTFDFTFFDDGATIGTTSADADPTTRFDIATVFGSFPGTSIEVNWVDADSVDISFFGGALAGNNLGYTLSSLDFMTDNAPVPIADVIFNRADSDIDDFIGDVNIGQPPESAFVEPDINVTDTSFTANFSFFDERLIADGPRLRFDVVFDTSPSQVPLPASGLLLMAGCASVLGLRRWQMAG